MSAAKHTPGPWQMKCNRCSVAIYDPNGEAIARLSVLGLHLASEDQEAQANARLMAAAPTMLEALQNLENDNGAIPGHAWDMVQKAIQQATGATA